MSPTFTSTPVARPSHIGGKLPPEDPPRNPFLRPLLEILDPPLADVPGHPRHLPDGGDVHAAQDPPRRSGTGGDHHRGEEVRARRFHALHRPAPPGTGERARAAPLDTGD